MGNNILARTSRILQLYFGYDKNEIIFCPSYIFIFVKNILMRLITGLRTKSIFRLYNGNWQWISFYLCLVAGNKLEFSNNSIQRGMSPFPYKGWGWGGAFWLCFVSIFSQIFYLSNPTFNMTHLLYTKTTQPYAKYCCQNTTRNTIRCLVANL